MREIDQAAHRIVNGLEHQITDSGQSSLATE